MASPSAPMPRRSIYHGPATPLSRTLPFRWPGCARERHCQARRNRGRSPACRARLRRPRGPPRQPCYRAGAGHAAGCSRPGPRHVVGSPAANSSKRGYAGTLLELYRHTETRLAPHWRPASSLLRSGVPRGIAEGAPKAAQLPPGNRTCAGPFSPGRPALPPAISPPRPRKCRFRPRPRATDRAHARRPRACLYPPRTFACA
jgi:hypothetical protein